jgi:DNA-binding MarR family transcriptional regulator
MHTHPALPALVTTLSATAPPSLDNASTEPDTVRPRAPQPRKPIVSTEIITTEASMPLLFPDDPLELEGFLPYRVATVSARMSRGLARRYERRFGISIPEWRCLAVLARRGRLTAGELAERTSLDKVRVSRAIARLKDRALVVREPDAHDRRAVRLSITPAGEALFGQIAAVARDWEQELTRALGLSERRTLDRVLHKLDDALARVEAADGD